MKPNYTLHLWYVLCVVIVLVAYPVNNYSAVVNVANPATCLKNAEKPVAQESIDILHSQLLFKY
jgi:hypothetical protein